MRLLDVITSLEARLRKLDEDDRGVAYTEYIIVFTLMTFGGFISLMSTAAFVKAYRDFMMWWLAHPAV